MTIGNGVPAIQFVAAGCFCLARRTDVNDGGEKEQESQTTA